ncbi:class I SAM-dependent DNA methyltransferase [Rubrivirga sp. IMCC45206]|uniref:class I SAM-dependent DNA methyltransferase n=1 Tax=Rubrivirga sp. IMCC45206 TaxID=3391614 RepID=UPI0039900407
MPDVPPTSAHRTPSGTIAAGYFQALYDADPDPWAFATSGYEAAKYAATLAALPRDRYARALEVGCAIGVLTRALADRCDALVAIDVADAALAQARERTAGLGHVTVAKRAVPGATPEGPFDLAVVSEVGYYLSAPDLAAFERQLAAAVEPGGHVVLVHWTGETDYPLDADAVHAVFAGPDWAPVSDVRAERYRLTVVGRR